MELLPPEVLEVLIINANPADIGRIACVSKYFKSFCEDADLWRLMNKVHFGGPFRHERGWRMTLIKNVCELDYHDNLAEKVVWAVTKGHYNALRRLLPLKPSLVNHPYNGNSHVTNGTMIHLACVNKHIDVVRVLVAFGAYIDAQDQNGVTALHLASEHGTVELLSTILAFSPNINHQDRKGRAAIHKATYNGRLDCVQLLLQVPGINIELCEWAYGQTALHVASGRGLADIAKLLIQHQANVDALDRDGWSPLHNCCSKGYSAVVAVLLNYNARTDVLIYNRWTARSLAEDKGHHEVVNLLTNRPQLAN